MLPRNKIHTNGGKIRLTLAGPLLAAQPHPVDAISLSLASSSPGQPPLPRDVGALRAPMLRAVRRTVPARLADEAEDLTHTALMRLARQLDQDPSRRLTKAYLARIAYTTVVDEIRRRRRDRERAGLAVDAAEVAALDPGPHQRAAGADAGTAIRECLDQAPLRTRNALTLYLLGHTVPEISRLLELGRKVAENVVYRGLRALRSCLAARGHAR